MKQVVYTNRHGETCTSIYFYYTFMAYMFIGIITLCGASNISLKEF